MKTRPANNSASAPLEAASMVLASMELAEQIKAQGEIARPLLLAMALGQLTMTKEEFNGGVKCLERTKIIRKRGDRLAWVGATKGSHDRDHR